MSDLPGSPGGPLGPVAPFDPLYPGSPAGPTYTHVHAYSMKYCDDYIIQELFKNQKTIISVLRIIGPTFLEDRNKYEYGQGKYKE